MESLGLIDTRNPLLPHPLNEGRVLWLLGMPPLDGGRTWWDLCGLRHGTLTGGPTWAATGRGDAGLALNGTSQVVTVADTAALRPPSITVAAWFRLSATPSNRAVVSKPLNGPPWSTPFLSWMIRCNSLSQMEFAVGNGTAYTVLSGLASVTTAVGAVYRAVLTYDQVTTRGYMNGLQVLQTTAISGAIGYGAAPVIVGGDYGSSPYADYFPGQVADVPIWSRALSPAEVQADYDLSRRGYPGVLRRA